MICRLIILSIVLSSTFSKVIETQPQKYIEIEVGQAYEENIPLFFKQYQHSYLSQASSNCEIKSGQNGLVRLVNTISHNTTKEQNAIRDRIIYKFEELRTLRIFVDAIQFQGMFIAVYTSRQVIFYRMRADNGSIEIITKMNILDIQQTSNAQFLISNNNLLLFTSKNVIKINTNNTYEFVKGYQAVQQMFDDIQTQGKYIYIGGNKGLILYEYSQINNYLQFISVTSFYIENTYFYVNKFQIDSLSNHIFILDNLQGVISVSLEEIHKNVGSITVSTLKVLISGCENIVITSYFIYLTCPQLVKIRKSDGMPIQINHNNFYPYEAHLSGERIFMYGHQQFAVFDMFGNQIQQHQLPTISEKSFINEGYIISFSDNQVSSSWIIPQRQKFYCYQPQQIREGHQNRYYITSGLCRQLFKSPQNNSEICQIYHPYLVVIKNSGIYDYQVEIILVLVWLAVMIIFAIIYGIRRFLVHRDYKQLVQQEGKEQVEIVSKLNLKKANKEQINQ